MHRVHLASAITALAFAFLLVVESSADGPEGAKTHQPMEIVIGSAYGQTPAEQAYYATTLSRGSLRFLVEDQLCAALELEAGPAPQSVLIGTPDQPSACSEPGAVIRMVRADGEYLADIPEIDPATRHHVVDWQILPGEHWGWAMIDFSAVPVGPHLMTANGHRCLLFESSKRTLTFRIGVTGEYDLQSAPGCGETGAELTFYDESGFAVVRVLLDRSRPFFAGEFERPAQPDPGVASLIRELSLCLNERVHTDRLRHASHFSASITFDPTGAPIDCAPREVYEALGPTGRIGAFITSARNGAEWAEGRRIPEELTPEDVYRRFPNLRPTPAASPPPELRQTPAEAGTPTPSTDASTAARNVAAAVAASVVLALGVTAAVEVSRRRGQAR